MSKSLPQLILRVMKLNKIRDHILYTSLSPLEDKEMADPFDDRIKMEQFHELFNQSDDSDEEFEGF